MNRLLAESNTLDQLVSRLPTVPEQHGSKPDIAAFNLQFPYQLFTPEHYESNYRYPLVIWLHSEASSERELAFVMESLSTRNYVAVAPRATRRVPGPKNLFGWSRNTEAIGLAEEMVFEAVDEAISKLSINPSNVFLAGYGSGGTLAAQLALRNPRQFAGVVSINGDFPTGNGLLKYWKQSRRLPILWMNGSESEDCGIDSMCDMLRTAYPAGLQVHPVQFADEGDLCTERLATMNNFLMQIVTNQPICLDTPVGT